MMQPTLSKRHEGRGGRSFLLLLDRWNASGGDRLTRLSPGLAV
jgi:hypothetical protein